MLSWVAMAFVTFMLVVFAVVPHLWLWIPWLILMIPAMMGVATLFSSGTLFTDRPRSSLTAFVAWIVSKSLWVWMLFSDLALLQTNNMSRASIAAVGQGFPSESLAQVHAFQGVDWGWRDLVWWPLKPWGVTHLGRIVHVGHPGSWALLCLKYDASMAVIAIGLMALWHTLSVLESRFWVGVGWLLRGGHTPQMQAVTLQQSFTPNAGGPEPVNDQEGGETP